MFVDASALVAILSEEEGWTDLQEKLARADGVQTSAICIWEASLGLARRRQFEVQDTEDLVRFLLASARADVIAIDDEIGAAALLAWRTFGKGRHPARLNMGDCFAYACAKVRNVAILCTGNDFARTDIELA